MASATLSKPLSRECLVNLFGELLWKLPGSGLFVTREPRLPRIRLFEFRLTLIKNSVKRKEQRTEKNYFLCLASLLTSNFVFPNYCLKHSWGVVKKPLLPPVLLHCMKNLEMLNFRKESSEKGWGITPS